MSLSSLWQRLSTSLSSHPNPSEPEPCPALWVRAAGLCCAVGYRLPAASMAIRAGVDHFQSGHFKTGRGEGIVVARLPDDKLWGAPRLGRWLEWALRDCLQAVAGELDPQRLAVIWLAPQAQSSGIEPTAYDDAYTQAVQALGCTFHASSGVLPLGRAGLVLALRQAAKLLQLHGLHGVVLAGVDSLLDPATLNTLLEEERLLVTGNADGFTPGEAAAAVLLQLDGAGQATAGTHARNGVRLVGYGHGQEPGRADGSTPSRAQGLTQALRQALNSAGQSYEALAFRCSDQNGESFYSREAAHAFTRIAPVGGNKLHLITMADCIGEVGAATGPAMLAHLSHQMPHPLGPGHCGILHLAGDDGARCAVVLRHTAAHSPTPPTH
jgi:3-oxoacyl-[acyl-carrier-protein] synthase I